jgi:hypothetical protein
VAGRKEVLTDSPPGLAKDREKGLTMENMKDIVVRFNRRGESGNIFAVIGSMYHQLRERGMTMEEFQPYFRKITNGHNYEEALATIGEMVTLIEEESE